MNRKRKEGKEKKQKKYLKRRKKIRIEKEVSEKFKTKRME